MTDGTLTELERMIDALSGSARADLQKLVANELKQPFLATPGPQMNALLSDAKIILYGGQAGGGKSALEIGAWFDHGYNGIIFRREGTQLDGLIQFCKEIGEAKGHGRYVGGNEQVFKRNDGGRLRFAGLQQPDDWRKHAGNARDYMAFDEAGEFLHEQVFSLLGWLRTTRPGQRTRMILASNPPRGGSGEWMITEFAPWLDKTFSNPALPGELRWAIVVASKTEWVPGPGVYIRDDEEYEAVSRTFIPASMDDNPYLDREYKANVQGLPEPLRSQLLYGDFQAGRTDHEWQVIPSEWIRQAQARWTNRPPEDVPMTCVAADVAQGGKDRTAIQARYDWWFGQFTTFPGKDTPDGPSVAAEIIKVMRDRCRVIVDAGGGYGGDTLTQLAHTDVDCYGFRGSVRSTSSSRDGMFTFHNMRSQVVWQFREALDPEYQSQIALPPDPELASDLSAFRYEVKPTQMGGVILVGPKDEMKERLGRSPDKGDCTIMANSQSLGGLKRPKAAQERRDERIRGMHARVITSNQSLKDKLRGKRR